MSPQLQCHQCGYVWEYSGSLQKATCPSCSSKVPVEENRLEDPLSDIAAEYGLTVEELKELLRRVHDND